MECCKSSRSFSETIPERRRQAPSDGQFPSEATIGDWLAQLTVALQFLNDDNNESLQRQPYKFDVCRRQFFFIILLI